MKDILNGKLFMWPGQAHAIGYSRGDIVRGGTNDAYVMLVRTGTRDPAMVSLQQAVKSLVPETLALDVEGSGSCYPLAYLVSRTLNSSNGNFVISIEKLRNHVGGVLDFGLARAYCDNGLYMRMTEDDEEAVVEDMEVSVELHFRKMQSSSGDYVSTRRHDIANVMRSLTIFQLLCDVRDAVAEHKTHLMLERATYYCYDVELELRDAGLTQDQIEAVFPHVRLGGETSHDVGHPAAFAKSMSPVLRHIFRLRDEEVTPPEYVNFLENHLVKMWTEGDQAIFCKHVEGASHNLCFFVYYFIALMHYPRRWFSETSMSSMVTICNAVAVDGRGRVQIYYKKAGSDKYDGNIKGGAAVDPLPHLRGLLACPNTGEGVLNENPDDLAGIPVPLLCESGHYKALILSNVSPAPTKPSTHPQLPVILVRSESPYQELSQTAQPLEELTMKDVENWRKHSTLRVRMQKEVNKLYAEYSL
jgi:hypothetical protein